MHLAIWAWIGLILLGSISIGQCYSISEEDNDEMILDERGFSPVARREQRYDYETLFKRLSFERRANNKKTCTQIKQNTNTHGMQQISEYWGVKRATVQACMADCVKVDKCIQWTYRTDPKDPLYQTCYLKASKGTESTEKNVLSGNCDLQPVYSGPLLLGVDENYYLWTRATLNSKWVSIPNSGSVIGVTQLQDGTILGAGTDHYLYTRATLNSNWVLIPNSGSVIAVTQLQDGKILGVGTDHYLHTRATLNSDWILIPNSGSVIAVTQLQDGTILGAGTDRYLYTRATLKSNWGLIPNSGSVIGVTQLPDGTILGVGTDHQLHTRTTLNSAWSAVQNSGSIIAITTLTK